MVFAGLSPLGIVGGHLPGDQLHETVTEIIKAAEQTVEMRLGRRTAIIKRVAHRLLQAESLSGEELRAHLEGGSGEAS